MENIPRWNINSSPSFPLSFAGNFDWVGNDFTQNAGTGLVINQADVRNNALPDTLLEALVPSGQGLGGGSLRVGTEALVALGFGLVLLHG